jgi:ribonuclease HI
LNGPPDVLDEHALTIYVDGSMRGSPRRGGIGIHFVWVNVAGNEVTWDHCLPATMGATNNEMELEAPTEALKLASKENTPFALAQFNKIVIRTDSDYVYGNWKTAAWTWAKTKWTKKGGAAVLNSVAWKSLIAEMKKVNNQHRLVVHFEWTKGKKGRHAKIVDKLAKQSSDSASFGRARPNLARRKMTKERVDLGSVKMEGQTMTVRIIVAQYLPPPRRSSRYKYEVVDEASAYDGKVDWAESDLHLRQGHTYIVQMDRLQANPRIEAAEQEVEEDLSSYLDALGSLGQASTAQQVADELRRVHRLVVMSDAVRRRLDRLVGLGQVRRARDVTVGRPYLYELVPPDQRVIAP